MESGLSRDTGPSSSDPETYPALIRFNGEPSIADIMAAFEAVLACSSASEIAAICGPSDY